MLKPVGQLLTPFATTAQSNVAVRALRDTGFSDSDISRYSPGAMQPQTQADIVNAGTLASLGQHLDLVTADLALSARWCRREPIEQQ